MTLRLIVPAVAAALLLGSCSDDGSPSDPTSTGEGEKIVEVSPLTGKPMQDGRPDNPVFVVKVENTNAGEPQYALDRADMVVEELVEGGLTRLAAFYYSDLPRKVGHVRSMRTTDIGIAKPVAGKIVASGGAPRASRQIRRAGVRVFTESSPGFSRDGNAAPYNVLVDLKRLNSTAKVNKIPRPYLTWTPPEGGDTVSPKAKDTTRATVRFSDSTATKWRYRNDRWKRQNSHAAAGQDFDPDTLIVMFCRVQDAGYRDPGGSSVPETVIEGAGRAVILTGGKAIEARWNKPTFEDTVEFETKDGKPLTIDPGRIWLEMVPKGDGRVNY